MNENHSDSNESEKMIYSRSRSEHWEQTSGGTRTPRTVNPRLAAEARAVTPRADVTTDLVHALSACDGSPGVREHLVAATLRGRWRSRSA
jgi:hypothetical protein